MTPRRTPTWPRQTSPPSGTNIPHSLGAVTQFDLDADTLEAAEDFHHHELNLQIELQQIAYLLEEAGAYHEWDGLGTLDRIVNELETHGYAEIPDEGEPTALWIFNPATAQAVGDALEDVYRRTRDLILDYPFLTTPELDEDHFILVDVAALAQNPAKDRPVTGYEPDDRFSVRVHRPWLVADPHGVGVVEGVPDGGVLGRD